jgi:predicted GNAT family acetyltransferase
MGIEHARGRGFSLETEGHRGVLDYTLEGDRMRITHTLVPDALRGRGIAGQLVRAAFDQARSEGWQVVAQCEYAAAWVERHPEYAELVVAD